MILGSSRSASHHVVLAGAVLMKKLNHFRSSGGGPPLAGLEVGRVATCFCQPARILSVRRGQQKSHYWLSSLRGGARARVGVLPAGEGGRARSTRASGLSIRAPRKETRRTRRRPAPIEVVCHLFVC